MPYTGIFVQSYFWGYWLYIITNDFAEHGGAILKSGFPKEQKQEGLISM